MELQPSNFACRSFMSLAAGWSQIHYSPSPNQTLSRRVTIGHLRSQSNSSSPTKSSFPNFGKPRSNTETHTDIMAADVPSLAPPATPQPRRIYSGISEGDFDLSTLPDPRSRSITPANNDGSASPRAHPDFNDEVATLSSKLIHAINHQTTLDDSLSRTRSELERARGQMQSMEIQLAKQKEMLVGDIWIRRQSVEAEKTNLVSRIAQEKRLRLEAQQEKKRIEQELESLTQELFEEANKMVISAKDEAQKETEAVQRKNDLLKAQLADTEGLLKSQQEQLIELKHVMEQMSLDQDDRTATTTPSSPTTSKFDSREDDTPTSDVGSQSGLADFITPSHPTSFTHLLQPVLRTDINAYDDFIGLCKTSRSSGSRPPSGSHSSLGLGLLGPVASASSIGIPSSLSTVSLSSAGSPAASSTFSSQTPSTPASTYSSVSASTLTIPSLKETKFYKRVLAEDVEPTLRLDLAPGLSWLARRSVISAISDGSLVVEPVPTTGTYAMLSKPQFYPCSLCGENRKDEHYLRRYRFRTSESSSSQRYPLCKYCLNRVRSTCDFLGFLRIVKDGHWRTDDEDAEKAAWEESVRLRENMFWARLGGGVRPIPQFSHGHSHSVAEKSPRHSHDEPARQEKEVHSTVEDNKTQADTIETRPEDEDEDQAEDFGTPAEGTTPEAITEFQPDVSDEGAAEAADDISVIVHAENAAEADGPAEGEVAAVPEPPRTPSPTENYRLSSQSPTPKSSPEGEKVAVAVRPQTPPPSDSNRISTQSLAPESSETSQRTSIHIPGFP